MHTREHLGEGEGAPRWPETSRGSGASAHVVAGLVKGLQGQGARQRLQGGHAGVEGVVVGVTWPKSALLAAIAGG